MKECLIINRFWLTKGLETYMLGVYFVFRQDLFEPPYHSILNYLDKLPSIIVLLITGTVAILYALTNSGNQKYRALMSGLITFVWMFFFVTFTIRDFTIQTFISIQTIYAFFVLISTLVEVVVGRR